ncbi:MAG: mechanosensitive ion channel family protein [Desulfurococcales archaeon]|nr:mechanosensitive ion channel family protein [Desulfurococcales archaeon]
MGVLESFREAFRSVIDSIIASVESIEVANLLAALITLIVFVLIGRVAKKAVYAWSLRTMPESIAKSLSNVIYYSIIFLGIIGALGVYGVSVSSLILAGGIAGIVIGFASQTVFSNLLSGLFLYVDRPLRVGDPVEVDGIGGVVVDIGVLSTRIIGWDGVLHRIPNERTFTAHIKNFSRIIARRVEYKVSISYQDDIEKAKGVILKVIEEEPLALVEPAPQIYVDDLGDNGVILTVRFWAPAPKWFDAKTRVLEKIKVALDEAGIEIPFPQRVVWFRTTLRTSSIGEDQA